MPTTTGTASIDQIEWETNLYRSIPENERDFHVDQNLGRISDSGRMTLQAVDSGLDPE